MMSESEAERALEELIFHDPVDEFKTSALAVAIDGNSQWESHLDQRETMEILFALKYADEFHHGTAGHNRLMLIAKLAKLLDIYEEILDHLIE